MKNYKSNVEQLELLSVKESNEKRVPAKRVDIVSLRLVKETSLLYRDRAIRSPEDGYNLFKQFLGELDREYFVVMCLDVKNQPTAINVCHIGSLNASKLCMPVYDTIIEDGKSPRTIDSYCNDVKQFQLYLT